MTPQGQHATLTPQGQAAVIGASRCFVCSGSGPMMLAQCTDVPIVAMEAMSMPFLFERERHGVVGWNMHSIMAPIDCIGCSQRMPEPSTFWACERGDNKCTTLFDPVVIADKVEEAVRDAA